MHIYIYIYIYINKSAIDSQVQIYQESHLDISTCPGKEHPPYAGNELFNLTIANNLAFECGIVSLVHERTNLLEEW